MNVFSTSERAIDLSLAGGNSFKGELKNDSKQNRSSVANGENWSGRTNGQGIYRVGFTKRPADQMELGRRLLCDQYINILHTAIHPRHGFVWTDGRAIFLSPVRLFKNRIQNEKSIKLGEFDYPGVNSVHWSCDTGQDVCFLSAVHEQNVSLWIVAGKFPKLSFKQVRKLSIQPVPQGCLWNPCRDILCVLSQRNCSLFFQHTGSKGTYTFPPIASGKFRCGTWSEDGNKLILGLDGQLMIYTWTDINKSVSNVNHVLWKIPQIDGVITSIVCVSPDLIVCSSELPLVSLCRGDDLFMTPDRLDHSNKLTETGESDIIKPHEGTKSVKETLLELPQNPKIANLNDTSQLILVQLTDTKEPVKLTSLPIVGIITPDILGYEPKMNCVVVGSNTNNILQVFTITGNSMVRTSQLILPKDEHPKGISKVSKVSPATKGLLLAVGKKSRLDTDFTVSSGRDKEYELRLKFFEIPTDTLEPSSQTGITEPVQKPKGLRRAVSADQTKKPEPPPHRPCHPPKCSTRQESIQLTPTNHTTTIAVGPPLNLEPDSIDILSEQPLYDNPSLPSDMINPALYLPMNEKNQEKLASFSVQTTKPPASRKPVEELQNLCQSSTQQSTESHVNRQSPVIRSSTNQNSANIVVLSQSTEPCELETEKVNFSQQKPRFQTLNKQFFEETIDASKLQNYKNANEKNSNPAKNTITTALSVDHRELDTSADSAYSESQCESLETLINLQSEQIIQLQKKIDVLQRQVELTSCVFPSKYQAAEMPETVHIVCKSVLGEQEEKTFLLDDGRLQLEPVKKAFNLDTVELFLDGDPCVLGANADGYIPMRFTPHSTLEISGKSAPPANANLNMSTV